VDKRLMAMLALQLAAAALSPLSRAESQERRDVGTYVMGDAAVRVTAAAPRVEMLVVQSPATMMLYLDGRSTLAWADSAEQILRLKRDDVPYGHTEVETTVLRHPDPSYSNGVLLTRVFRDKRTHCYLTTWVGRNSYTAIEMSDKQARSVVSALKRAAMEVGGGR
jgi:hypothetical protein